jgi:hypothetical protein
MAVITNNVTGITDGTAITTSNSGTSPDTAWTLVSAVSGSIVADDDVVAMRGEFCALATGASGQSAQVRNQGVLTADDTFLASYVIAWPTMPAVTTQVLAIRRSGGNVAQIQIHADGTIEVINAANASIATSAAGIIKAGMAYRLELRTVKGASTSTGTIQVGVFLGRYSRIQVYSFSSTTADANTVQTDGASFLKISTGTNTLPIAGTAFQMKTGADALVPSTGGPTNPWAYTTPIANLVDVRGEVAANVTSETSTAIDLPDGADITTGNYLIARIAANNSGTNGAAPTLTISDAAGNTWTVLGPATQDPGAANEGVSVWIAWAKVVNAYSDGSDITLSWNGTATTAKSAVVEEWTDLDDTDPIAVTAVTATGASTAPSVGITPTASGQIVMVAVGVEGPGSDAYTPDSDSTDGTWANLQWRTTNQSTATDNITINGAAKLVTGTTAQTWTGTITSRDWAAVAVVLAPAATVAKIPISVSRISTTTVEVDWTHPGDAPNGVTIVRASGTYTNDGLGNAPDENDYDPMTISGAAEITTGETTPPYNDVGLTPGEYTYWVVRTGA